MRSIRSFLCVCVVALLFFNCDLSAQTMAKPAVVIQTGSMVAFDYTLTDESGTVIDSSKGKEPMHYVHGKGQIIPGLEKELEGLPVGGEKKVTVKPEDGYGPVNPQAFQEIPKEKLPPEALKGRHCVDRHGAAGPKCPGASA
jgi:FKBP-type peptidyl-prolyl cis-trans isomerases 2